MWLINKFLTGTKESARAVIQRCSINKVLRKIAQNSQENTSAGVSFKWSFRHWDLQLYWKVTLAKVFSCEFYEVFNNTYFVEYLQTAAFELVLYYIRHIFPFLKSIWKRKKCTQKLFEDDPEFFDELFVLLDVICTFS